MRFWGAIFVSFVISLATALAAQTTAQAPPAPSNMASGSVRIVSPASGEKIRDNFVDVRFEVTNPGVSVNTPTFQVQLDQRDPVQTTSTDQPFNGLTAGVHTVSVELVDANGTPINGSRAQLQFTVAPAQPPGTTAQPGNGSGSQQGPRLQLIGMQQNSPPAAQASAPGDKEHNQNKNDDDALPQSGSALPLISLIGFGVLVGGITSALKTR